MPELDLIVLHAEAYGDLDFFVEELELIVWRRRKRRIAEYQVTVNFTG